MVAELRLLQRLATGVDLWASRLTRQFPGLLQRCQDVTEMSDEKPDNHTEMRASLPKAVVPLENRMKNKNGELRTG